MKMRYFLLFMLFATCIQTSEAQIYDKIAHYFSHGTPTHGIKIKTNIPFVHSADMATITLKGYAYGQSASMNLQLSFYIWHNPEVYFHNPVISSSGAYTPNIALANEGGKVVIFIDDRVYYHRFYVDAFSGFTKPEYYQGWSIVDEPLTGTSVANVLYKNAFKGNVTLPDGIWTPDGRVGIGTFAPKEMLSVNGKIRAHEVKVETSDWPDYVFADDYKLTSLRELEEYIKVHGHLPEIPKANVAEEEGISLGEMNKLLLKKVEEITLYLIEQEKDKAIMKRKIQYLENKSVN